MRKKDLEIAKKLKEKLEEKVMLVDFKVFGSRARDEHAEDSDLDVFIVVERMSKEIKNAILGIVWEVGFEHYVYISPLIFSRYEMEQSPLRASLVVETIAEEGVRV